MMTHRRRMSPKARWADAAKKRAAVAKLAYELYQRRGKAPGGELEDWVKAERIMQERWSTPPED